MKTEKAKTESTSGSHDWACVSITSYIWAKAKHTVMLAAGNLSDQFVSNSHCGLALAEVVTERMKCKCTTAQQPHFNSLWPVTYQLLAAAGTECDPPHHTPSWHTYARSQKDSATHPYTANLEICGFKVLSHCCTIPSAMVYRQILRSVPGQSHANAQ